ncbi:cold regulated protein 27 [Rhynchospora pubera]|uniref:Cold regulated protein 27 n=1 Tax=Rhynchospora pubera TaxID=906938 RepID=A0AAV8FGN3_9POAL|nr:cold regulated protein 27 [Rhynchospora pubera]
MKAELSHDGQFEVDDGEVQSKGHIAAGSRCSSWTNEKHMHYLSSLEESFVNQLHSSQFHLHFMNLLGGPRTNQRQSDSSITSESLSDTSESESLQKRCQEDMKFEKTKARIQNESNSISLSENQWIRHFAPNFNGKGTNIRANCQAADGQPSNSSKSVKREFCCSSKESTSQAQPSSSSRDSNKYREVSDQNFYKEDIAGAELIQTYKKRRLSSPVPPLLVDLAMLGKPPGNAIREKG